VNAVLTEDRTVTALLQLATHGDAQAFDDLVPIVYDHLRRLAHRALRGERRGHTLNTTALAHEAYAKLAGLNRMQWQNRAHFFAVAAQSMRRILVDYAVARKARKRGGGWHAVALDQMPLDRAPLTHAALLSDDRLDEVLSVDAALTRLARIDARIVRIIECRVFMGMTIEETAEALELSPASVKRHWTTARAWLTRELTTGAPETPAPVDADESGGPRPGASERDEAVRD
jgi:RNA polymerase sigma factor (TIGR02999 family)